MSETTAQYRRLTNDEVDEYVRLSASALMYSRGQREFRDALAAFRELQELRPEIAHLTKELEEARAEAERQSVLDHELVSRFSDNPDAKNWMGWRTPPDEEGRVFDIHVQLVGGETVLDRYRAQVDEIAALKARLSEVEKERDAFRRQLQLIAAGATARNHDHSLCHRMAAALSTDKATKGE